MNYNSPLTHNAILYTWRQLFQRAGLKEFKLINNAYEANGVLFEYIENIKPESSARPKISVMRCNNKTWHGLLFNTKQIVRYGPTEDCLPCGIKPAFGEAVPTLFWGHGYEDGHKPFVEKMNDSTIIFYVDIIAATFFMLTRWEETLNTGRDEHDRFLATKSVAYKHGFFA